MKKKVFLILFMFVLVVDSTNAVDLNSDLVEVNINENYRYENTRNDDETIEQTENKNTKEKNKLGSEKKILKNEIKNRKRLHKNLVREYNNNFDEKYLDLISQSGLLIDRLDRYYRVNFM